MADPADIVEVLSDVARDALLNGTCGVPRSNDEWTAECICEHPGKNELREKKLAYRRPYFPGGVIRNERGEQVRQLLSRGGGDGE